MGAEAPASVLNKAIDEGHFKNIDWNKSKEDMEKIKVKAKYLKLIAGKTPDWGNATELLVGYLLKKLQIYTTKSDEKSEMWVYKDGVYVPMGRSEVRGMLRNVLEEYYTTWIYNQVIAKLEPDTYIEPREFFMQKHTNEIPVENGILNVETLQLSEFNPKKIFFNKLPVKFDLEASCSMINKFLEDVLAKPEDVTIFYELAGFGLLDEYRYEKAFMFVGLGRNGKGKSLEILKRLFGMENCCSIPLVSLTPESFSIGELFGKRLNLAGDIGSEDLKETSMFKSLTGRDLVNGKRKFLCDIPFENYAKFVFACNDLPMVYDMSRGFWDRWVLLEFPYTFVDKEEYEKAEDKILLKIRDENIVNKISTPQEMSGLLNAALAGLHRLMKNRKFSSTAGSEEVKSTWIKRSNSFIAFCYEFIEEDYDNKITKKELRKRYANYCKKHKISSKSDFVMKKALQETYGANECNIFDGISWTKGWEGIKWKNQIGGL